MGYQSLANYNGEMYEPVLPSFEGIEYDYTMADNIVMASPGGVSSTQSHYTKGFYGQGGSSSDMYAGQGDPYKDGIYGNLYSQGPSTTEALDIYPSTPNNFSVQKSLFVDRESTPKVDHFAMIDMSDMIEDYKNSQKATVMNGIKRYEKKDSSTDSQYSIGRPQGTNNGGIIDMGDNVDPNTSVMIDADGDVTDSLEKRRYGIKIKNPWILFVTFILLYVGLTFWSDAIYLFIKDKFNSGKDFGWGKLLIFAIVTTLLIVLIAFVLKIPVIGFEQV